MSSSETTVSASVFIERPILDVFYYVCDPARLCEWVPVYTDIQVGDEYWSHLTPRGKSFTVRVGFDPMRFYPREASQVTTPWRPPLDALLAFSPYGYLETVTCIDLVPGRSISFKSRILPQTTTITFEPLSEGTLVTATHTHFGWSFLGALSGGARMWARDYLGHTMQQLKFRLEALRGRQPREVIVFSYRREKDHYTGGRICESLSREFGDGSVFRDVDSINGGSFHDRIEKAIAHSYAFIPFFGQDWLAVFQQRVAEGKGDDFMLKELKLALETENLLVLPVLEQGVLGPERGAFEAFVDKLPPDLGALKKRQYWVVRADPDFRSDIDRVVRAIWDVIPVNPDTSEPEQRRSRPRTPAKT